MSDLPDRPAMSPADRQHAEALYFEGVRHMEAGDDDAAARSFRGALQHCPDFSEACLNLGYLLGKRGDAAAAEDCYRRSCELDPSCAQAHLNLGAILAAGKRFAEAETAYSKAIALDPGSAAAWSNLGALYACAAREAEAELCLRNAMALDQHYPNARYNLAYVLLKQGRFEEGWACFEARNWHAALAARLDIPRWRGETLQGKAVLVGYEGGHGDMIQFCRYLDVLRERGVAALTLICHPALKRLFETLPAADQVLAYDEPLPQRHWDCWVPLLSLPYLCGTRLDSIPASIPYLRVAAAERAKWAAALPAQGVRVGLVWRGSPRFENDADRSLPSLELLQPLAAVPGVRLVSLQKGCGEEEARHPPPGLPLIDLGSQMADFADAAAIVDQLDLLIAVDTALVHLAGALGKPCWVLLPAYKPDWRWLAGRSDSPWYPGSLRLFRQQQMGEWTSVIAAVARELEQAVRQQGT